MAAIAAWLNHIRCRLPAGAVHPHGVIFPAVTFLQERFMPFFSERGYDCYAVSFRGQGAGTISEGAKPGTLASNAADIASFIGTLPARPVAVSHSFGGLVLQKCGLMSSKQTNLIDKKTSRNKNLGHYLPAHASPDHVSMTRQNSEPNAHLWLSAGTSSRWPTTTGRSLRERHFWRLHRPAATR